MVKRRLCIALVTALDLSAHRLRGRRLVVGDRDRRLARLSGHRGEVFKNLIGNYNKGRDVKVTELYSSSDLVLQKVLTAVRGRSAPTRRVHVRIVVSEHRQVVRSSTCPTW